MKALGASRTHPSFVKLDLFQHKSQPSPVILKQVRDNDICGDVFECPVHDDDDGWLAA